MLDYMSTWHSLVFKAVHQNCLQTYLFTQQHEWAIYYVPSVVLSPGESRNESSQGTAMCYLVAQVTTKERTAKCFPLKVHTHTLSHTHTHTLTHTHTRQKQTRKTKITTHGITHAISHSPDFYWAWTTCQQHSEWDRPGFFFHKVYRHSKRNRPYNKWAR